MANSVYEYVKHFELPDVLLPSTWLVVRVDGNNFHALSHSQQWTKPNDIRQLRLMNAAAQRVMSDYSDIVLSMGMSDEYSFVLPPASTLYNRRRDKLVSSLTSLFTSAYALLYPSFFPSLLPYPPHFDGRIIAYPSDEHLRHYLCWRQVDVHVNNLYNTAYWALRQRLQLSAAQAHARLDGTDSAAKHEMLWKDFGVNYNDEDAAFRKGSIILWERHTAEDADGTSEDADETTDHDSDAPDANGEPTPFTSSSSSSPLRSNPRVRRRLVVVHEDLITSPFFTVHPGIIPPLTHAEWKKLTAKESKQAKKAMYRAQKTLPQRPTITVEKSVSAPGEARKEPADAADELHAKTLTFLAHRPLSIASMSPSSSPRPPSPLPPSPQPTTPLPAVSLSPSPSPGRRASTSVSKLNASVLYHDIVGRVFSDGDRPPPSPTKRATSTSDAHTPLGMHRRIHKSGFAQLEPTAHDDDGVSSPTIPAAFFFSSAPDDKPSSTKPAVSFDLSGPSHALSPLPEPPSASGERASSEPISDVAPAPPPPGHARAETEVVADGEVDHHRTMSSEPFFEAGENARVVTTPTRSAATRPTPITAPPKDRPTISRVTSAASSALSVFDTVTADASPTSSPSQSPMSLLSPSSPHRLFDHFLVLGSLPSPNLLPTRPASWTEEPRILLEFPHSSSLHSPSLPSFAFPTGVRIERLDPSTLIGGSVLYGQRQFQRTEHVHLFLIKMSGDSESQLFIDQVVYGVCVQAREVTSIRDVNGAMHELSCDTAYCLLSHFPFFALHADVLFSLLMLLHLHRAHKLAALPPQDITHPRFKPLGPHQVPACVGLLKKYYAMRVPAAGDGFVLEVDASLPSIVFERAGVGAGEVGVEVVSEREVALSVSQWSLCVAWTFVSAEMLVDMLECALRETKIIVVDPNLAMLSSAVLSFIALLRPLSWASIILPILPANLHDFLDAPVPILAGVPDLPDRLCQQRHLDSNTAVWFPSGNKLWLPQGWRSLLPGRSRLRDGVKRGLLALRKGKPSLVAGKVGASGLTYKCPAGEWPAYDAVLKEMNDAVSLLCDYVANTEMGRLPRDKEKEPFAKVMRQTQMMQRWLERHRETVN